MYRPAPLHGYMKLKHDATTSVEALVILTSLKSHWACVFKMSLGMCLMAFYLKGTGYTLLSISLLSS